MNIHVTIFSLSQPDETWRSISSSLTMSIMTSSIASFSVFPRSGFGGPIDLGFPESTDPSPVHIYKDGHQNSKDWDDDHANSYRQDSIVVVVSGIKRYQSTLKQKNKNKIKDMNIRNPWKFYLLQIRSSHAGVLFRIKHNLNTVDEKPFIVIIFFVCSCLLNIFSSELGVGEGVLKHEKNVDIPAGSITSSNRANAHPVRHPPTQQILEEGSSEKLTKNTS